MIKSCISYVFEIAFCYEGVVMLFEFSGCVGASKVSGQSPFVDDAKGKRVK
jgi:hypothetical protein